MTIEKGHMNGMNSAANFA